MALAFCIFCSALGKSDQSADTKGKHSQPGLPSGLLLSAVLQAGYVNALLWLDLVQSPVLFLWLKDFLTVDLVVLRWKTEGDEPRASGS